MKKNEINLAEIERLLNSLFDDDIDILSIEFTENKKLVLYMKLMNLIEQIKNYSAIDE